jgi:hypothetical protein
MIKRIKIISLLSFFIGILCVSLLFAQQPGSEEENAGNLKKSAGFVDNAYGILNKGELINCTGNYGTISDCILQNSIYNFTWPKSKGAETVKNVSHIPGHEEDATDDFSFIFATASVKNVFNTGTVIDGYIDYAEEDWRGVDGASGHYHCALEEQRDYLIAPEDGSPMMATSDLPESWPAGWMEDDDIWPGVWRPGPTGQYESLSENDKALVDTLGGWYDELYNVWRFWPGKFRIDNKTGKEVPGEFAGDRHVWCIMDDQENHFGPQVGIVVEMEGICYGRPYAEDYHFYDFTIRNISGSRLDSCWWGYYLDPSFGDVDEEEFYTYNSGIDSTNDQYNVFIQFDPDGQTVPDRWREIGVFGIGVLKTPHDIGVTDAHYNPDGNNYKDDWKLWYQIIGDKEGLSNLGVGVEKHFHGPDPHLDDFSLSWGEPGPYGLIVMSGPFSMEAGEKVKGTIVVCAASDQVELMSDKSELESGDFANNIQNAQNVYLNNFQGPSAPPAPKVYSVTGDRKVTLYWDDSPETAPDDFTGELDFEGYKIYRSVDDGATWGDPITNAFGQVVGYVPLKQFDIDNNISGIDPVDGNINLGSNTGLKHCYVDNYVHNGIRYTYSVVSYDRGDHSTSLPSMQSARGTKHYEKNIAQVTPRSDAIGYEIPFEIDKSQAKGKGTLTVDIVVPVENRAIYQISFVDSPATSFTVSSNGTELAEIPMNSDDDSDLINGIRFSLEGDILFGGVKSVTDEYGNNVLTVDYPDITSNWYVESAVLISGTEASIETKYTDYEIRFTSDSSWAAKGGPNPQLAQFKVPFSVWNVSVEPNVQTNCLITGTDQKYDLDDVIYISAKLYTANAVGDTISSEWKKDFAYKVDINATVGNGEGKLPIEGQKIKIATCRAFTPSDLITVTIDPPEINATKDEMSRLLDEVRVVPNPYVVNAQWETMPNTRSLRFMFLPGQCDISIYTVAGELVTKLHHNNGTGDEDWNMLTQTGQEIAFGLYIYVIETNDSSGGKHEKVGKFIVIK